MSEEFFRDSNDEESSEDNVNNFISKNSIPLQDYSVGEDYIFISYSNIDSKEVFKDIKIFHNEGFPIWFNGGLTNASQEVELVSEALINSSLFVAFISPESIESHSFQNEIFLV